MTPFETNHISTTLGIDGTDCKPALIFLRQSPSFQLIQKNGTEGLGM
ncbi:MAG: hypothetical protein LEGION0403_FIIPPAGN_02516 [Legionella sp.]